MAFEIFQAQKGGPMMWSRILFHLDAIRKYFWSRKKSIFTDADVIMQIHCFMQSHFSHRKIAFSCDHLKFDVLEPFKLSHTPMGGLLNWHERIISGLGCTLFCNLKKKRWNLLLGSFWYHAEFYKAPSQHTKSVD